MDGHADGRRGMEGGAEVGTREGGAERDGEGWREGCRGV